MPTNASRPGKVFMVELRCMVGSRWLISQPYYHGNRHVKPLREIFFAPSCQPLTVRVLSAPMDLNSYLTWKDGRVSREGTECRKLAAKARTTPYYVYMLALG